MGNFKESFKVKYSDVNQNGELTPKGFIKYLQDIANSHSEKVGYGFVDITKINLAWILLNWKVQIFKKPTVADIIHINTWPSSFSRTISYREFEVYDSDNNLICIATSKWALTNHTTHSLERFPAEMPSVYGIVDKKLFDDTSHEKAKAPENSVFTHEYTIQRRDIDTNKHVNNLCYIDFAYEALPEEVYTTLNDYNFEIAYKKEIKYKDTIKCFYAKVDDKHIVTIKNEDLSVIHAIVTIY